MSFRQTKNGKWTWDFYPRGRKGKRIVKTLPAYIKTKEEAEKYAYEQLQILNIKAREGIKFYSTIENLFKEPSVLVKTQN